MEEGSGHAEEIWNEADEVVTHRLTYIEVRAALAASRRSGLLSPRMLTYAKGDLTARWRELDLVELDEQLAESAGDAAETFGLRANDSLHLAAAQAVDDSDLVVATWDGRLRTAALDAGLAVAP